MHIDFASALMAAKLIGAAMLVTLGLIGDEKMNRRSNKKLDAWRRKRDGK